MKPNDKSSRLSQIFLWIIARIFLILVFVPSQLQISRAEKAFTPLFNGRDLTGWIGDPRLWKVEDGVIVGSTAKLQIQQNSFLSTTRSFTDFVLRVSVKLVQGNSGIQFRSEQHPDYVLEGYQADIDDKKFFGMLYEEGKRGLMGYWGEMTTQQQLAIFSRADLSGWNQYEIICDGDRIRLKLNGHIVCDIVDPKGARAGVIGLQLHTGDPMKVLFKDIEIQAPRIGAKGKSTKQRFQAANGFQVEQVASDELLGSVVNLSFDHLGRPVIAREHGGIHILLDGNNDGIFEQVKDFSTQVQTAHGMHYLGSGDLLVNANGPKGPGLYRLIDDNGDDQADSTTLIAPSQGRIGEHGPHAILTGLDGSLYVLYGNHAYPDVPVDPYSPSRRLTEDHLLERYLDPRGHANSIKAPGGTIHRLDLAKNHWTQISGGFRNAFDFALNEEGEIFTFDSDMEWDFGLPWYRPIRIIHAVAGGDYGWRTGSGKFPDYYADSLPGAESLGRGSPVGIVFYQHLAYPKKYQGALFLGDWSRGRILVSFPEKTGATYTSNGEDFVLGQPLNVTDLAIGPDGLLYFSTGGRSTTGGLYCVRKRGSKTGTTEGFGSGIQKALTQPMHRSAWGKLALSQIRNRLGSQWDEDLVRVVQDPNSLPLHRVRALELMQIMGPRPKLRLLKKLALDEETEVRAAAVLLLGTQPLESVSTTLQDRLNDPDPLVARRSCESLLRAGLFPNSLLDNHEKLARKLFHLMDHPDRFLRHSARLTLERMDENIWKTWVLADSIRKRPRGSLEGLLALIRGQTMIRNSEGIFRRLLNYSSQQMNTETRLLYLRVCQLALLRSQTSHVMEHTDLGSRLGAGLLSLYPTGNPQIDRELEHILGYLQTPGAVAALLQELKPEKSQEDQINIVYALRSFKKGWSQDQRLALLDWFKHGRTMPGAASMHGYISLLWKDVLALLPKEEKKLAEAQEDQYLQQRADRILKLINSETAPEKSTITGARPATLVQMSFAELSSYLDFDPMTYERGSVDRGRAIFHRAKCSNCHVFGNEGRGGGPDLSTAIKRFRRTEILESIMFPSKVISDQYTALIVEVKGIGSVTGMLADETDRILTLIDTSGEKLDIQKSKITDRRTSQISIMPEDLLETMGLQDLVNLFLFLEQGSGF